MIHLRAIDLPRRSNLPEGFPFSLPFVRAFEEIAFDTPVTFLVGENGSGKSTLIEAIAAAAGSHVVGGESMGSDATLAGARELGRRLKCVWARRTHRGFFLRAEDFFRFARRMTDTSREMDDMAREFESQLSGYGLLLAKGAALAQKSAITSRYGEDLHAVSHGESFLKLFQTRFVPGGLYLLDEPEAPLSPHRQLALLAMLKEMSAEREAQFIVATHSPILMALPGAAILSFDACPIRRIAYKDSEHVALTRDFLNNPAAFLRHL